MSKSLKIDFVGDVSCPWCAIGLGGLQMALERLAGEIEARIVIQPFELNPGMPSHGENLNQHLQAKYAAASDRFEQARLAVRERAQAVGLAIVQNETSRIYNTFDAHRLLAWAAEQDRQVALLRALFAAYFSYGEDISSRPMLAAVAEVAGLDPDQAFAVLASDRYIDAVSQAEQHWRSAGITSVPAAIVDDKYLILGGQPPEGYEQALRTIAAQG
ncbi:MAG: oxidoreductase [Caulobacteraceae bacterium]|nr:oxidoreductase [Caulobacteraceae bacterium]